MGCCLASKFRIFYKVLLVLIEFKFVEIFLEIFDNFFEKKEYVAYYSWTRKSEAKKENTSRGTDSIQTWRGKESLAL